MSRPEGEGEGDESSSGPTEVSPRGSSGSIVSPARDFSCRKDARE